MAEWRSIYGSSENIDEQNSGCLPVGLVANSESSDYSETHESNQPTLEYRPVSPVVNVWYTQQTLKTVYA